MLCQFYLTMLATHLFTLFIGLVFVGSVSLPPDSLSAPEEVFSLDGGAGDSDLAPFGSNVVDQNVDQSHVDQNLIDPDTNVPQGDSAFSLIAQAQDYVTCEGSNFPLCCKGGLWWGWAFFSPRTRVSCVACRLIFFFYISYRINKKNHLRCSLVLQEKEEEKGIQ